MLGSVLAQRGLDLLILGLIIALFGDVESGSTTAARGMATPGSARSTAQGRERAFSPD